MDPCQIRFINFHKSNSPTTTYLHFKFPGRWMLTPEEGGRLDAKRHYVILAKALDAIWPIGHACAACAEAGQQRRVPQHSTAQA